MLDVSYISRELEMKMSGTEVKCFDRIHWKARDEITGREAHKQMNSKIN